MLYLAETPRLYLERLSEKHLIDFHELWNNDEAVLWSSKPKKNSVEESREWLLKYILNVNEEGETDPGIDKFALLLKTGEEGGGGGGEDGEGEGELETGGRKGKKLKMIGFVGTNRWCEQGLEVGYCLNRAYWGRGYITEGFQAFLEIFWGLPERKEINRLIAKTHPENGASQRVCVKCGGRRGETLVGEYERWVDGGVKSDVWLFYFERPEDAVEEGDWGMGRTGGKGENMGMGETGVADTAAGQEAGAR